MIKNLIDHQSHRFLIHAIAFVDGIYMGLDIQTFSNHILTSSILPCLRFQLCRHWSCVNSEEWRKHWLYVQETYCRLSIVVWWPTTMAVWYYSILCYSGSLSLTICSTNTHTYHSALITYLMEHQMPVSMTARCIVKASKVCTAIMYMYNLQFTILQHASWEIVQYCSYVTVVASLLPVNCLLLSCQLAMVREVHPLL